jgi:uncharacterized DUF497 family protein
LRFEWDDKKNARNRRKHRISFETAVLVFQDPRRVTVFDSEVDGEERWHTVGLVKGQIVVLVVHTMEGDGDEVVRMISARKATPTERRIYEGGLSA